jgi:steroid delta-isomerase-like uncharacterized protein
MSVESTRAALMAYFQGHDPNSVAEDAVYTIMGAGQETRGREAINQLLHHFYEVVFDRQPETRNLIVADGQLLGFANSFWEGDAVGTFKTDFAGIPANGQQVRVPIAVIYDFENDQIKRARIYFETDALRQQAGVRG